MVSKKNIENSEKGLKFDEEKIRFDLIPGDALEALAKVYTYGTKKYSAQNWRKGLEWSRVFGALMRHAWAFWRGEEIDEESGLPHIMQAAWACFSLHVYSKTRREFDDRIKDLVVEHDYPIKPGWYKHFKGETYLVVDVAKHTETEEVMVVYQSGKGDTWCRPMSMFMEKVEHEGNEIPRFERVK